MGPMGRSGTRAKRIGRQGGLGIHIIPLLPENGTNVMNYDVTIYRCREGVGTAAERKMGNVAAA